jgi:uncharacterized membrane protein
MYINQLLRLATASQFELPLDYFIRDITFVGTEVPVATGAFAWVYRGLRHRQDIAVKRFKMTVPKDEREKVNKVRVEYILYIEQALMYLT